MRPRLAEAEYLCEKDLLTVGTKVLFYKLK